MKTYMGTDMAFNNKQTLLFVYHTSFSFLPCGKEYVRIQKPLLISCEVMLETVFAIVLAFKKVSERFNDLLFN